MNIVLIGFMATGKSAVGRRVAERLGWSFFDTDDMIERRPGTRSLICSRTGAKTRFGIGIQNGVVGRHDGQGGHRHRGGVPLRSANMDELERTGRVVLLTASSPKL
jgi:shikimate kinase